MTIDYNKVIAKFLKTKKDERQDDSHYLRGKRNPENKVRKENARKEKYDVYIGAKINI